MSQELSTPRIGVQWAGASRKASRTVNADAVASRTDPLTGAPVLAVADGIGDDVLAVEAARQAVHAAVHTPAAAGPIEAVLAAHRVLDEQHLGDCVLVVAMPFADRTSTGYRIAWVGDCRAHLWNGATLTQLTVDQTVAEYFRARGSAPDSRFEHMVTNSVRTTDVSGIGWNQVREPHGLLLTTDGVHKVLPADQLRESLCWPGSVRQRVDALVDLAATRGTDNATAMLFEGADLRTTPLPRPEARTVPIGLAA